MESIGQLERLGFGLAIPRERLPFACRSWASTFSFALRWGVDSPTLVVRAPMVGLVVDFLGFGDENIGHIRGDSMMEESQQHILDREVFIRYYIPQFFRQNMYIREVKIYLDIL